jgi:diguanylate cyclase (GGDEF)-like protein
MTMLQESYMAEILTGAETPEVCLGKIYESKYLLKPYKRFYICLNDEWLNTDADFSDGYSNRMLLAISAHNGSKLHGWSHHVFIGEGREKYFSRKSMLPAFEDELKETFKEPQVYYFAPLHFGKVSLGYAVLQNDLSAPGQVGQVFRNYIRNINNALEMSRTKYRSIYLSEHDAMTGLRNRRGLENAIEVKISEAEEGAKIFAIVADMDGLKKRNDSYGHSEGDNGINLVAKAIRSITDDNEISVRGGGDEFFVLGVGNYTEQQLSEKVSRFRGYLETANETMSIPVEASIGYSLIPLDKNEGFQIVLDKADAKMYEDKRSKKSEKVKK